MDGGSRRSAFATVYRFATGGDMRVPDDVCDKRHKLWAWILALEARQAFRNYGKAMQKNVISKAPVGTGRLKALHKFGRNPGVDVTHHTDEGALRGHAMEASDNGKVRAVLDCSPGMEYVFRTEDEVNAGEALAVTADGLARRA